MPTTSAIRYRPRLGSPRLGSPRIGLPRPIAAQGLHVGNLSQMLPKGVLVALVMVGLLTAGTAVYWVGNMHGVEAVAAIDAPISTGSISKAN